MIRRVNVKVPDCPAGSVRIVSVSSVEFAESPVIEPPRESVAPTTWSVVEAQLFGAALPSSVMTRLVVVNVELFVPPVLAMLV